LVVITVEHTLSWRQAGDGRSRQVRCHGTEGIPTAVIEIQGLRKEYRRVRGGRTVAVDGLDLTVPEGGVFGFLGPNGAGKTTTIRCLLGLVRPNAGRSSLLGATTAQGLARVIRRVGSIVEAPAFFPRFSGRRNLGLLGRVDGIGSKAVEGVLERVGLSSRADDPVKTYSLGMKQRLGIAAALLKDPELLILDEPANGLDPAGIKEVRDLLRRLGAEGRTVFVSSHQLAEVQQMCDRVAILSQGRCVAGGSVSEVLTRGRHEALVVRLGDLRAGLAALQEAGITAAMDTDHIRVDLPAEDAARVTEVLARSGLYVSELRPQEVSLETVFLELTQGIGEDER
jgi:ABC-2 type transport system ATP-binding protein